jgi:hypothetical protein
MEPGRKARIRQAGDGGICGHEVLVLAAVDDETEQIAAIKLLIVGLIDRDVQVLLDIVADRGQQRLVRVGSPAIEADEPPPVGPGRSVRESDGLAAIEGTPFPGLRPDNSRRGSGHTADAKDVAEHPATD